MTRKITREEYVVIKCPVCGGEEFIFACQGGYGALTSDEGAFLTSAIRHQICRQCGTVVRSFVDDPDKLLKRKDRKCDSINI